ncbi:SOS response-associated peptidase [Bacillus mangrovi]|uniref:Abasic site processing protein n=1 Tax=Metabacillus mangrovi TaxID=1491830 RepID=A0A7X2V6N2_9BACI|nr:SOS response-associated peptidase [Metabacillus mangrovi]MTH55620.1 SOS response-associated peptidase [Metabacillus mangrovi]
MCGRFSLDVELGTLQEAFQFEFSGELQPRYNIAPSQNVLAITADGGRRTGNLFRWGLVPPWSKDLKIGYKMINARSETAAEKPSFKRPFQSKRCLIPASGYFEWKREGKEKRPFRFIMKDEEPFVLAGLYEKWEQEEEAVYTCTILTTSPNSLQGAIHDRMPVILNEEGMEAWLDKESRMDELKSLCRPFPAREMRMYEVSQKVNSAKNETAEILSPLNSQ